MLIEYDYTLEDDHLIIAKIKNLSSRKEVLDIPVSSCKRLEVFNGEMLKNLNAKKLDCSLNTDEEKYMLFFEKDSAQNVLVFEPNDNMRSAIKKELNR